MTISGASRVRRRWAVSVAGRHGSLRPAAGEFIASVNGLGNLLSPQSAYSASRARAGAIAVTRPLQRGLDY